MATAPRSAPSQSQIVRLYTLAGRAGLAHEAVIGDLRRAYGVESTKDLTLRQYEEFCLYLQGKIGAGKAPAMTGEQLAQHYPAIWKREQIEALLREEWPALAPPELRGEVLLVLDDIRLGRRSGRISPDLLRATIERLKRCDLRDLKQACADWLAKYRDRGSERWFLGMVRSARRDRERGVGPAKSRTDLNGEVRWREKEAQHKKLLERVIFESGAAPKGEHPCREGLLRHKIEDGNTREIPCPWCEPGRSLILARISERGYYPTRPWGQIKFNLVRDTP